MNGGSGPEIPVWLLDPAETGASGYTTQQLLGWTWSVGGKEAPTVGLQRHKSLRRSTSFPLLKMGRTMHCLVAVLMFSLFSWKRKKTGSRTHMVVAVNAGERCAAIVGKTEWRRALRGSRESMWKSRSIAEKRSVNGRTVGPVLMTALLSFWNMKEWWRKNSSAWRPCLRQACRARPELLSCISWKKNPDHNTPNWQWPPRLLSTGELCSSRWLLQLLVQLVKQQCLALERTKLHSCGDSWSGVVWCFRSYSMKTDLGLLWSYRSHLTLFLSLTLVERKENLFARLESYFSLSPPCLAECTQYLGGNRQRPGKELTVKNEYRLMAHFGSTDLGRPLIVPSSDLLKMEGRERDIGLLGQT